MIVGILIILVGDLFSTRIMAVAYFYYLEQLIILVWITQRNVIRNEKRVAT